jgi:hypothetical protein
MLCFRYLRKEYHQHYLDTTAGYAFTSMAGLLVAAQMGDIARMKELLAEGASITERGLHGWGVVLFALIVNSTRP